MSQRDEDMMRRIHEEKIRDLETAWQKAHKENNKEEMDRLETQTKQALYDAGGLFFEDQISRILNLVDVYKPEKDATIYPRMPIPNQVIEDIARKEGQAQRRPSVRENQPSPPAIPALKEPVKPKKPKTYIPQPPPHPGSRPVFSVNGAEEELQENVRYKYVYGIRDMRIESTSYKEKAMFLSKEMNLTGNVMEIALASEEKHPLFDDLGGRAIDRQTSVEYFVSYEPNPSNEDWVPILPEGQATIPCERLLFDTARTATLLFPARVQSPIEPKVYRNGMEMETNDWSFAGGGSKIQLLSSYDPSAVYTVRYTPNDEIADPWKVDIMKQGLKKVRHVDEFPNGTATNKSVTLTHYPYIDWSQINDTETFDPNTGDYVPISVSLEDASIAGPGRTTYRHVGPEAEGGDIHTRNITDYILGEYMEPAFYRLEEEDRYTVFEYTQDKNKLYFSETFNRSDIYTNREIAHGNATVRVAYEYLQSNFRLKVILRNNAPNNTQVTPEVDNYTLKFKVME